MAKWTELEMTDEEKLDAIMPMAMDRPDYPCGLCLSFDKTTISKIGLEELPEKGELLDLRAMMTVTHVSDGPNGPCFEAQIVRILNPVENESREPEMEADEPRRLESDKPLMERGASAAKPGRRQVLYRKAPGANWDENLA